MMREQPRLRREPQIGTEPRPPVLELVAYWGVVAAWMLIISLMSGDRFSEVRSNPTLDWWLRLLLPYLSREHVILARFIIRTAAHVVEFFILGCLAFWAARRGRAPGWRQAWMWQALAVSVGYAAIDEIHQAFVPNRTASLGHVGTDSIGAAASQVFIYARYLVHRVSAIRADRDRG